MIAQDDMAPVFLVMDASARRDVYRAAVLGPALPNLDVARAAAMRAGGVVVRVLDAGEAYLRPEVVA